MDSDKNRKATRNRKHYEKGKHSTDFLLLRLPRGGKARIDQMTQHFGVARPALFDVYLLPFLGVIAEHQLELSLLAKEAGCSIPTLLTRLIRAASAEGSEVAPESVLPDVANDFDALFGGPLNDHPMNDGGH